MCIYTPGLFRQIPWQDNVNIYKPSAYLCVTTAAVISKPSLIQLLVYLSINIFMIFLLRCFCSLATIHCQQL